jgi:hypothetical protein
MLVPPEVLAESLAKTAYDILDSDFEKSGKSVERGPIEQVKEVGRHFNGNDMQLHIKATGRSLLP